MKKILTFFLIVCLFSCGKREKAETLHSVDSRVVLRGTPAATNLSEIAEKVTLIPLETRDDVLIDYATVAFADSLLLVYASKSGLHLFDSEMGAYKHSLIGFRDRGPLGYSPLPPVSHDLLVVYRNKILLEKWDRYGVWDFTTGQLLDEEVLPMERSINYLSLYFVNDSTLLADRMNINPGQTDKIVLISVRDGSVIHGFGQVEAIDSPYEGRSDRSHLYEYDGNFSYQSIVCDTIYGIDRKTHTMEPRFVLNLDGHLFPNVKGSLSLTRGYISVSAICESERYLFLRYTNWGTDNVSYHYLCYDKKENRTLYVDKRGKERRLNGFENDLSSLSVRFFPEGITPDGKAYCTMQAIDIVSDLGPERAAELGIAEDDNPVIVVVDLKK